jgi:hypothetical protein
MLRNIPGDLRRVFDRPGRRCGGRVLGLRLAAQLHNPVMLARQIATLDVLSGGRARVGLGQGWSLDDRQVA